MLTSLQAKLLQEIDASKVESVASNVNIVAFAVENVAVLPEW